MLHQSYSTASYQPIQQQLPKSKCPKCGGIGGIQLYSCNCCKGKKFTRRTIPCNQCSSKGALGRDGPCDPWDPKLINKCVACDGKGYVKPIVQAPLQPQPLQQPQYVAPEAAYLHQQPISGSMTDSFFYSSQPSGFAPPAAYSATSSLHQSYPPPPVAPGYMGTPEQSPISPTPLYYPDQHSSSYSSIYPTAPYAAEAISGNVHASAPPQAGYSEQSIPQIPTIVQSQQSTYAAPYSMPYVSTQQPTSSPSVYVAPQTYPPPVSVTSSTTSLPAQTKILSFPSGTFFIKAKHSGLVLDAEAGGTKPGTKIIQWDLHRGTNQQWQFDNGVIRNVKSGLALVVSDGLFGLGSKVCLGKYEGKANQRWKWDGLHLISEKTGEHLDIYGELKTPGTQAIMYTPHARQNQQFELQPVF